MADIERLSMDLQRVVPKYVLFGDNEKVLLEMEKFKVCHLSFSLSPLSPLPSPLSTLHSSLPVSAPYSTRLIGYSGEDALFSRCFGNFDC